LKRFRPSPRGPSPLGMTLFFCVVTLCVFDFGSAKAAPNPSWFWGDILTPSRGLPGGSYGAYREMAALTAVWEALPAYGQRQAAAFDALHHTGAWVGGRYGGTVTVQSRPYAQGGSSQADVIEARGSSLDLMGAFSAPGRPGGRVELELRPEGRLTPTSEGGLFDGRVVVLAPTRLWLGGPLVVSPVLEVSTQLLGGERLEGLAPGAVATMLRSHRRGLTVLRGQAGLRWQRAEQQAETGSQQLRVGGLGDHRVALEALWLYPLDNPAFRFKTALGGERSVENMIRTNEGSLEATLWESLQTQARVGAEARLEGVLRLGLETVVALGIGRVPEGAWSRQVAYGLKTYLHALSAKGLEVTGGVDLRRSSATDVESKVGVYQVSARWEVLVGGRF